MKKFAVMVIIYLVLVSLMVISINGLTSERPLSQYDHFEITVGEGETLWKIASRLNDGSRDTREIIHYIKTLNNSSSMLRAGQTIIVPDLKEVK